MLINFKGARSYIIGLILSLVIIDISFGLAEKFRSIGVITLYIGVFLLATVYVLIQVLFFIRLNNHEGDKVHNVIAMVFSLLIISIIVIGSLWIMYSLNYNMVH